MSAQGGFSVPGYDVVELLGYGSGGEVWLAREQDTGDPVALKRVRDPGDGVARERLHREAVALTRVEHPHLVRLRTVLSPGDELVLVLDLAGGGSLAALLAARGPLSPGEVVTLAVPLAQALAAVHAYGLVHGDVTPGNVLFADEGRPLLTDLGVSRLLGLPVAGLDGTTGFLDPALDPGPAGDVHGLAATCVAALTGRAPYDGAGRRRPVEVDAGPLLPVLERALDPDPAARPGAAELAVALFDALPAEPVRLTAGPGEPPPVVTHRVQTHRPRAGQPASPTGRPGARRRAGHRTPPAGRRGARPRRPTLPVRPAIAISVGVGLVVASALAVIAARPGDPPSSAPARHRSLAAQSSAWRSVLDTLDRARSAAFATGDVSRLDEVYRPGSPAGNRDRAALRGLLAAGLRADGVRLRISDVRETSRAPGEVRLRVVDRLEPYRLVDRSGRVVQQRPGRGAATWVVTLHADDDGWRVGEVVRV